MESDQRSSFLFGRIFFDEPVSTSSENALADHTYGVCGPSVALPDCVNVGLQFQVESPALESASSRAGRLQCNGAFSRHYGSPEPVVAAPLTALLAALNSVTRSPGGCSSAIAGTLVRLRIQLTPTRS